MASPTELTSSTHLSTLLKNHALLIIDFHATWCGPCHAISPFFTQLSKKHSSPGHIIFTKCDVEAQSSIARTYSVTAMPTFIILHNSKEVARVRGADPSGLSREVEKWVAEAGGEKKGGFQGDGQVLGSTTSTVKTQTPPAASPPPRYIRNGTPTDSVPLDVQLWAFVDWLIMIFMLYLTSLFSLDPFGACEGIGPQGGGRGGWAGALRGFFGGGGGGPGGGGSDGGPGGGGRRPVGRKLGGMDTIPGSGRTIVGVNSGSCCG